MGKLFAFSPLVLQVMPGKINNNHCLASIDPATVVGAVEATTTTTTSVQNRQIIMSNKKNRQRILIFLSLLAADPSRKIEQLTFILAAPQATKYSPLVRSPFSPLFLPVFVASGNVNPVKVPLQDKSTASSIEI